MARRDFTPGSVVTTLAGAAALATLTPAGAAAQDVPTFTADVAPILFESCGRCH